VKNSVQRYISSAIAIPVLFSIILALPHYNYLAFAILVAVVSVLDAHEMESMLTSGKGFKLCLPFYVGILIPIAEYARLAFGTSFNITSYMLYALIGISLAIEALTGGSDGFKNSRDRLAASVLILIYPYYLAIFFIRFCFLNLGWAWLLLFFVFIFSSDSFAYIFGKFFGKSNRGIVKVSPNKSVAGYVAGLLIPAIEGFIICSFDFYDLYPYEGMLLGFATAVAGSVGDLVESVFKRCAGIKDSGRVIPGRGGMLDSTDSLIMAVPLFMMVFDLWNLF